MLPAVNNFVYSLFEELYVKVQGNPFRRKSISHLTGSRKGVNPRSMFRGILLIIKN